MSRFARTGWLFCLLQQLPVSSIGVQMLERNGSVTSCHAVMHHLRDSPSSQQLRDRLSIVQPLWELGMNDGLIRTVLRLFD